MLLVTGCHQDFAPLIIRHNAGDSTVLRSILFNIFINDLNNGMMYIFGKFVDDTKLGGMSDTPDGCATIQRDLDTLENWAERNLIKFDWGKCNILHPWRNNPRHRHTLGTSSLESSFAEKALGVLVENKLNMSEQCTLTTKKANTILSYMRKSVATRLREVILPLNSVLVRPHLECCVQSWAAQYKICTYWSKARAGLQGLKHRSCEERLRELGQFSLVKRRLKGA
ncbi:hypothetical protein QYF61_027020 [Mycteria americana]|uniref:Rna-directed dna polymerase from mobile element jockey-like n=1 Tax=Mycteria americana TaxID=33587 RepID=A0AAN7SJU2_MYCAM|nr:hypothetical protein QYF61_027020 [Mycteria americana]